MPLFLLTQENVGAAKAALRKSLPTVRSAHLTEALAAGLGFNTNAALRAAMVAALDMPPSIADGDADHFRTRLAELGYKDVATSHFLAALSDKVLIETPYILFRKGDRAANDRHYHVCQRRNRPMMMIKMATRYAELEWDCITIDSSRDDHVHDAEGDRVVREMYSLFQARSRGSPGKPFFDGSAFTGRVTKLLPDIACELAEDYFKLLYVPMLQRI